MRIVGLPESSGAVVRRDLAVSAVAKATSAQKVASEACEANAPILNSRVSAGSDVKFDQDRVAEIRKALETGNYPLTPTKIADAIIAVGMYGKVVK